MSEQVTSELVLSFCPPGSAPARTSVLTATGELPTGAVLAPLFHDRPASGTVPLAVNLSGQDSVPTRLHAPWILSELPDQVALGLAGEILWFRSRSNPVLIAPPDADRAWLRPWLRAADGLLEVLADPDTPFGATWEACLEARHAGRGEVRLALPIRSLSIRSRPVPPACAAARSIGDAILEPFLLLGLLLFAPVFLLVAGVVILGRALRTGIWCPQPRRLSPRSELEAKLFEELGRCPACGEGELLGADGNWACHDCGGEVILARAAEARAGAGSSGLIDLRGWIELAERRQAELDAGPPLTANGLCTERSVLTRELVHCLTQALALYSTDGELRDGAALHEHTADRVRSDPQRFGRDRIVAWLFELPALSEIAPPA